MQSTKRLLSRNSAALSQIIAKSCTLINGDDTFFSLSFRPVAAAHYRKYHGADKQCKELKALCFFSFKVEGMAITTKGSLFGLNIRKAEGEKNQSNEIT